ncbi:hypothetical protein [Marinicella gelatinilytica]|uniref:hypothetical protein n=1 Tax=Marinicella gelatinilytica TaxID=2996017 RepID=UPI002260A332|nr:hypothetical protein [Marinicella gelatinilytica]MCX7546218.1 hypothetical protein [Marinicella gelatinilytica]
MDIQKRKDDLIQFYTILNDLKESQGLYQLFDSNGFMDWPQRGVYFFFENGELRGDSGGGSRVTRIGTHALKAGSKSTLWKRLSQHKGVAKTNGGNHRGSIFRLLIGDALIHKEQLNFPTWSIGSSGTKEIRDSEIELERKVTNYIGQMPFVCLPVNDKAGPTSLRDYFERNAIALISNYGKTPLDTPSNAWLGLNSSREKVFNSGLWNQIHVDKKYDNDFISVFGNYVEQFRT